MGHAVALNSALGARARREAFEAFEEGKLDFLFLAPEQLGKEAILEELRAAKPALFVIDEAHCVSEWGHDFRPDYLRLGAVIEAIGHPTVLARTATAAPPVREEIVSRLCMREPKLIVQGFDRPALWLGVEWFNDEASKERALLDHIVAAEMPGIVYVATRKHAERVADLLDRRGIRSTFYHAWMKPHEREAVQHSFMDDAVEVIVATIAFGKPNVHFVFHYDISDSLDSYYQEIGRVGRDGNPARAILFYRGEDLAIHRFLSGVGQIDIDELETVARAVEEHHEPVETRMLRNETHLSQTKLMTALTRLEETGVLTLLPTGKVASTHKAIDVAAVAAQALGRETNHRQYDRSRLEMICGYAELYGCRRAYLLSYFGEPFDPPFGNCDNYHAGHGGHVSDAEYPFPVQERVVHTRFGPGTVQRYDGDAMIVPFDDVGYKTLGVGAVLEHGLLRAAE